jgi:hypothetical protein
VTRDEGFVSAITGKRDSLEVIYTFLKNQTSCTDCEQGASRVSTTAYTSAESFERIFRSCTHIKQCCLSRAMTFTEATVIVSLY